MNLRKVYEKRILIWLFMLMWAIPFMASANVTLSPEQQAYLTEKKLIKLCVDPDWLPYEGIDEKGNFTGIMSDFFALWSDKIGIPIQLVNTASWNQSLQFVQQGKCDILSSAQDLPSRREWLTVTEPYIFYPLAVATQPDHQFVVKFEQIQDRDFVMVQGYAGIELLRNRYPDINITTVKTPRQGLKLVETGKAYGYIDTVPTINYQMLRWGISHLKITGVLEVEYAMSVGISIREPQLREIFNKAIADTTEVERQSVLNNWLSIEYTLPQNNRLVWQILAAVTVILLLLVYRYRQVHHHNRKLRNLNTQLEQISRHDHLTGLANRYALHERFSAEMDISSNTKQNFSILLLDVDFFKTINDEYGHDVGDDIIKEFALLILALVRENDLVGRWGGEEFLILCSQTSVSGAFRLAEEIRVQIENFDFSIDKQITASIGVSEYRQGEAIDDTIKRADEALYRAKNNGRNQIVMADSE